jgi:hypothetical protein
MNPGKCQHIANQKGDAQDGNGKGGEMTREVGGMHAGISITREGCGFGIIS